MDAITNRSSRGEQSKFFQQMRDEEETSATNWTRGVFAFTVLGILVIVGLFKLGRGILKLVRGDGGRCQSAYRAASLRACDLLRPGRG